MAVFAVREHHAGKERAERRRQADDDHEQRDRDHHKQRGGREELTQTGHGNEAENGPGQVAPPDHDERDCAYRQQCALPAIHAVDEAQRRVSLFCSAVRGCRNFLQLGQGKQGDERQHRDYRYVLEQQDGEA